MEGLRCPAAAWQTATHRICHILGVMAADWGRERLEPYT